MADESFQEKTEAPSQRKRDQAREKGQVARSVELSTAFGLLAAAVVVKVSAPGLARMAAGIFTASMLRAGSAAASGGTAVAWVQAVGWQVIMATAGPMIALAAVAAAIGAIQARGTLTTEPLTPDWSRIAPQKNLGRIVSARALVELLKSLAKLGVVGAAVYASLHRAWPEIVSLAQQSPVALLMVMHRYTVRLLATAGLAFLAIAAADYAWQLWTFEKQLRMTKEEVKQEMKESEGDPLLKQRIRSAGRALARKRMFHAVPTADVVVTNPTHIAVALKYDALRSAAPVVVAMGERKVAERIKAMAHAAGVPVIENRPLARALNATARLGQPIPVELYVAVAEVLAFVMRQRAARGPDWARSAFA